MAVLLPDPARGHGGGGDQPHRHDRQGGTDRGLHRYRGRRLQGSIFADNFWGGEDRSFSSVFEQATGTMLITVFVFLGIEGASVYARFAKKREDVGRATVIGFLSVLSVFALVTLLSYGVLPQQELAGVAQPSMASVLEAIVGHWGSIFIWGPTWPGH
jgi:amino acid transporter